jgi:hypothetical protein
VGFPDKETSETSFALFEPTTSCFSDAEYLVRPCVARLSFWVPGSLFLLRKKKGAVAKQAFYRVGLPAQFGDLFSIKKDCVKRYNWSERCFKP